MQPLNFTVVTNKPAPPRSTTPTSHWRNLLTAMRPGHWFEVPKKDHYRIQNAANKYVRGKYSIYMHPTKKNTYIFTIIK